MSLHTELVTLVAVAGSSSFAAAARRLSLSPAMVGRRIPTCSSSPTGNDPCSVQSACTSPLSCRLLSSSSAR